jgi:hexosaminidase
LGGSQLEFEVDESYTLKVPDPSNPNIASLQAATVYGALRGLETFSQLVDYDYSSRSLQIARTPWIIEDYPRFPYRGLLIDTSRHYQPVESIKRVIDSMSFAKLNVLHWHIVDEEAFPIEIPSYPGLWNGAYSYKERYNIEDASEIVEYINI